MHHALLAQHADDAFVAFGARGARTAADLLRDAARIAAQLPEADVGSQVLFVVRHDRYLMACALLACMVRGHAVALPPEIGRESITALLAEPRTQLIVHDMPSRIGLKLELALEDARHVAPFSRAEIARAALEARVFRREERVALHEQRATDWLERAAAQGRACAPGTRSASSVAPGQALGIVHGILLPLQFGAAFLREYLPPSALAQALPSLAVTQLVGVAAHVRTFLDAEEGSFANVATLLCGQGHVRSELRQAFVEKHGDRLVQLADGLGPDVAVDPLAAAQEALLCTESGVVDAAVVHVPGTANRYVAAFVGAADGPHLRALLAKHYGEGLVPASLLRVERIPRESTGQYPAADVLRWFRLGPNGAPLRFALPSPELEVLEPGLHVFQLQVPTDYAYYDGHFAGYPIMAGAVQLGEVVLPCVRRAHPQLGMLQQVTRLKFTGRIQPGDQICVELVRKGEAASVDFTIKRDATLCAGGTLLFGLPAANDGGSAP